ncbi:MAG: serine/threonine protein kinase, partial [Myxococcales bacterium]|nr:serine/threonine protein kinase [Myxococcales bacterium]
MNYDEADGGRAAELAGQTLAGRYRVEKAIGRGPLGTVYRAEDTEHRKRVAIKVFDAEIEPDGDEARRLLADLETASGLMNPHLVPPLDAGVTDKRLFVVEPLLAGQSLADRLEQEGPQAPLDAVRYALEVLVALDALHRHHILHLDLKPQNLFVVRDPLGMERVLVAGVGQQHALGLDAAPARSEGQSRATAAYLAPEIVSGKPRDMRTDLYQLGLVLYEVLTGRPPFDGDPPDVLARRHVLERPPSPRFVRGDDQIPDALDLIVVRCLEKVARKRFSSAGEMTSALEQVAQKGAATAGGVRFRAAALAAGTRPPVEAEPPPFADFADEPPPEGPITRLDVRKLLEPAPRIDAPPQLSETPKVTAEDIAALRRPRRTPPIGSAVPPADDAAPAADAAAMTLVEGGRTLVDPIYRPPPRPAPSAVDDGEDDTGAFDGSAFPGAALDAIEENPRRIDTPAARAPTMPVELAGQTHADARPAGVPVAAPESRRSGPLDAWQKRISAPPAAAPVEAGTRPDDANDRTDEHLPLEDEHSAQRTIETPSIAAALAAAAGADAAETGPDRMGAAPAAAEDDWSVGEDPEDTLDGIDPRRPKPVLPFVIAAVALAAVALVFVLIPKSTPEAPAPEEEATRVTIGS